MRVVVTATVGGAEVGRQVARVGDMHGVVSTMAAYVANLQCDDNNEITTWLPASITIETEQGAQDKKGK